MKKEEMVEETLRLLEKVYRLKAKNETYKEVKESLAFVRSELKEELNNK